MRKALEAGTLVPNMGLALEDIKNLLEKYRSGLT
jgi:hypothetical protein